MCRALWFQIQKTFKAFPLQLHLVHRGGISAHELLVIADITPQQRTLAKDMLIRGICEERALHDDAKLYIMVHQSKADHTSLVETLNTHTSIVSIDLDGECLFHMDE